MLCLITFETHHHARASDLFVVRDHLDPKITDHVEAIGRQGFTVHDVQFLAEADARRMVDEQLARDLASEPSPSQGADPIRSPSQED